MAGYDPDTKDIRDRLDHITEEYAVAKVKFTKSGAIAAGVWTALTSQIPGLSATERISGAFDDNVAAAERVIRSLTKSIDTLWAGGQARGSSSDVARIEKARLNCHAMIDEIHELSYGDWKRKLGALKSLNQRIDQARYI